MKRPIARERPVGRIARALTLTMASACLLAPATASATVVSSEGGMLTLACTDAGEPISIAVRGGLRTLGDTHRAIGFQPGEIYVAGPGCTQGRENDVECPSRASCRSS